MALKEYVCSQRNSRKNCIPLWASIFFRNIKGNDIEFNNKFKDFIQVFFYIQLINDFEIIYD